MSLKLEELLVAASLNAEAILHIKQYITGETVLKDHQITVNQFLSGVVPTSAIGTDIGMLVQLVDNGGAALPAVSGVNLTNVDVGTGNSTKKGSVKLSDSTGSTLGVSQGVAATPKAVKTVADQLSTKLSESSTPTLTELWTFQDTINAPGIVDDTTVTIESSGEDVILKATAGIIRTEDALALASITYNTIASLNSALVIAGVTPTKGMWAFVEGQGIVWYNGSAWVAIYSYINTSGFVTEVGNWTFAGNVTFSKPLTVAAASATGHAANLGQVLAAIDAISVVSVGTGSSVIKAFNTTTDTISLRSIKAGTGISVKTVGDEIVISATGGGGSGGTFAELTDSPNDNVLLAAELADKATLNGGNVFDIGDEDFIVTDDPSFSNFSRFFGLLKRTVNPTAILAMLQVNNSVGSNSAYITESVDDDGSVSTSMGCYNDNGSAGVGILISPSGDSEIQLAADNITIDGEVKIDLSGAGKSFIVIDDETTPTKYFGIFDDVNLPATGEDYIYGHHTYISGDNVFGSYWLYDKLNSSGVYASTVKNANGQGLDALSVDSAGVSLKSITADKIQLTGVQQHSGYKSGTLASPPSGMVIGEIWADTTDSATHPIIRVSTINT